MSGSVSILDDLKSILMDIDDWTEDFLDTALKNYQKDKDLPIPKVNQPIRIALTGSTKSPSLGLTLEIFGKKTSLERIQLLKDKLSV